MEMPEKKKQDLFRVIIADFIERVLSLRFDICRCQTCRESMIEKALAIFKPYYVQSDDPANRKLMFELINKHFKAIMEEVSAAVAAVSKDPPHPVEEDREQGFNRLLEMIYEDRGLDFSRYHRNIVKRRIALRVKSYGLDSYAAYAQKLSVCPQEYEKLFEVLTINVSEFFRDLPVWAGIRNILQILAAKRDAKKPIRVWSAGCARGEEAYSLAILIKEMDSQRRFEIYGTDIDADNIKSARQAEYDSRRLYNIPRFFLRKYFAILGKNTYRLNDSVRNMVIFERQDLIHDAFFSQLDIIVCRNVFIYFTKPLQEHILSKFYDALGVNKCLVMGKGETMLHDARIAFETVDTENRIYCKRKISSV